MYIRLKRGEGRSSSLKVVLQQNRSQTTRGQTSKSVAERLVSDQQTLRWMSSETIWYDTKDNAIEKAIIFLI